MEFYFWIITPTNKYYILESFYTYECKLHHSKHTSYISYFNVLFINNICYYKCLYDVTSYCSFRIIVTFFRLCKSDTILCTRYNKNVMIPHISFLLTFIHNYYCPNVPLWIIYFARSYILCIHIWPSNRRGDCNVLKIFKLISLNRLIPKHMFFLNNRHLCSTW